MNKVIRIGKKKYRFVGNKTLGNILKIGLLMVLTYIDIIIWYGIVG